jgi:DNA-binding MarR family transcriptional regulator
MERKNEAQAILDSIRRMVRALRISSREIERSLGLSGAQLFVLQKLEDASPLSMNELAERTLTHQSSVSVVVSRLVDRGLVTRAPSPRDGRQVALSLSGKGRALLGKAPVTAQSRLIEAIGALPWRKQAILDELFAEVVTRAGLGEETPALFFEGEERGEEK